MNNSQIRKRCNDAAEAFHQSFVDSSILQNGFNIGERTITITARTPFSSYPLSMRLPATSTKSQMLAMFSDLAKTYYQALKWRCSMTHPDSFSKFGSRYAQAFSIDQNELLAFNKQAQAVKAVDAEFEVELRRAYGGQLTAIQSAYVFQKAKHLAGNSVVGIARHYESLCELINSVAA